jgi:hypothetical protein
MTTSADGTIIGPPPLPLPTLVDAAGNVWCIGPTGFALVNNVATNGHAVALEWAWGSMYSKSPRAPGNWWKFTGTVNGQTIVNAWVDTGSTADPAGQKFPIVSFAAQVWDGAAWSSISQQP